MKFDYVARQKKLRAEMQLAKLDLVVLGGADRLDPNAYYYSGDTAFPTVLAFAQDQSWLFTTFQPEEIPAKFDHVLPFKNWRKQLFDIIASQKPAPLRVGFDQRSDTLGFFAFEKTSYEKVPFTKQLLSIRELKDKEEIKLIKKAQDITKQAVATVLAGDLRGLTENNVAGKIEHLVREAGASLDSFTPLVQSGEKTAVFHSATSNQKIDHKLPLLIDVGAKYEFYCADHTYTYYEGSDKEIKDALEAVKQSQVQSQKLAVRGASGQQVTQKALEVLAEYGYKQYTYKDVGLGLGHGVGLEVHDGHRRIDDVDALQAGMCFTVEPGLYFPKKFGVRFEDIAFI